MTPERLAYLRELCRTELAISPYIIKLLTRHLGDVLDEVERLQVDRDGHEGAYIQAARANGELREERDRLHTEVEMWKRQLEDAQSDLIGEADAHLKTRAALDKIKKESSSGWKLVNHQAEVLVQYQAKMIQLKADLEQALKGQGE